MRIAVDAMGGDFGAEPLVAGAIEALKERDFELILVGDSKIIAPLVPREMLEQSALSSSKKLVRIEHCSDVIEMDEQATAALKRKESSIFVAMDLLKKGEADAVVSAGHSGATMSLATLRIGRLKGVLRPAICTFMPRIDSRRSLLIDAGANTDCKPENLFEFGIMGYEYAHGVLGYERTRIGLLANGEEECKGDELTKAAFALLSRHHSFIGNVEGGDIFNGNCEVIVCDGFVGNVVLKTAEGVAEAISKIIKDAVKKSPLAMLGAVLMKGVFAKLKKAVSYDEYGGAPLLGVNGVVIIGHGKSNAKAMKNAVFSALDTLEAKVNEKILASLENLSRFEATQKTSANETQNANTAQSQN